MKMDEDGWWTCTVDRNLEGKWYGYKPAYKKKNRPNSPYIGEVFADPYSRHVTVKNNYRQEARSYIFKHDFDWEDTDHCFPDDPRDLVIYESHIKDLTAHSSSKASGMASYQKLTDTSQKGGIAHLKKLGVNCVELLPLQKFATEEPPYNKKTPEGFHNTWNPYSENYWGYMTSFFFAPESRFASDYSNHYSGKTTAVIDEFKQMVKALHKENITVLMDVVYNHTSIFDLNPLTHLAPQSYLRFDDKGKFMNRSGTGNEFKSENPIARKIITDSLLYWIEEYKIDGFRFDLAALLDRDTWDSIKTEVHKKHPNVVLIAEPWGGYYSPEHFSNHDWASWNDRIRNSIKGADPVHDRGFIFAEWQHETRRERIENVFKGTLNHGEGGLYQTSEHSVNYLESHDGYTLADFIRIGLDPEIHNQKVQNLLEHSTLTDEQMKLSKLAAISLFTAQGITMIHAGQEFGRSKVIAKSPYREPDEGKIDHNSYQKDNETNWLNFDVLAKNKDLFDYYKELIKIRLNSPALRKCDHGEICFDYYGDPLVVSFFISGKFSHDNYNYYIIINSNAYHSYRQNLPSGLWEVLANESIASLQSINTVSGEVNVPARSGLLLRKLRH
jgi:pullulanase/glycogen debranching enzyme